MSRRGNTAPVAKLRHAIRQAMTTDDASASEAEQIGAAVSMVGAEIAAVVPRGSLYWMAPIQFVVEQMAPRVCRQHGVPLEQADNVAAYLMAGMNEYVVALASEFDVGHFEAWTAALAHREAGGAVSE